MLVVLKVVSAAKCARAPAVIPFSSRAMNGALTAEVGLVPITLVHSIQIYKESPILGIKSYQNDGRFDSENF